MVLVFLKASEVMEAWSNAASNVFRPHTKFQESRSNDVEHAT